MDSSGTSLNDLVSSILRGSRNQPVDLFQDWALNQVKSEIPFDACQWITGSIQNHIPVAHSIHLHNLPTDSIGDCAYQFHNNDPFVKKVLEHPDKTFDVYETMNRDQFVQSEFYQCHRKSRKIEHAIATAVVDQTSKLLSITAFYRHDYNTPFTSREKEIKSFLSPILVETYNINLIVNLFKNVKEINCIGAICDGMGVLREVEPGLTKLIREEWPNWQGPMFNFSPDELLKEKTEARFDGKKITIAMSTQHDLVLLEFRKKRKTDTLTPSEHAITHHLVQGLSNKEIAEEMSISPKTVDNHLQHIFVKLNISNRKRAIVLLKDEF